MTFAPKTLTDLSVYWQNQGGVSLGIVGDINHRHGYHLGKDRLGPTDYSIYTVRDKTGLSNAASALDLGKLNGSLKNLYAFSVWLVEQCQRNVPGSSDVREIIYSPDGSTVLRWDRERGPASKPRTGEADSTHLAHTHISWYRDAETRPKIGLFSPYFEEGAALAGNFAVFDPLVQSLRTALVKAGTPYYWDTELTRKRGSIGVDSRVQVFGNMNEARAIQITTGIGYADKQPRPTIVFVDKDALTNVQDAAAVVPRKVAVTVDGKIAWEGAV